MVLAGDLDQLLGDVQPDPGADPAGEQHGDVARTLGRRRHQRLLPLSVTLAPVPVNGCPPVPVDRVPTASVDRVPTVSVNG